jgi:alpha-D-xyloside xylohydrolase
MFKKSNSRTFGLVRASNGGAASLPYVIYNDYYEHKDFITALANSGFAGVLWTPEVRSSDSAEEWLRRFQSNVFSPMAMINAWASGTKPWSFTEVEKDIKEYALLRMQMMPYWYTEFAKYHFEGIPPFRAMYLEEGFLQSSGMQSEVKNVKGRFKPSNVKDQYMAGEYILVAPMFKGDTSRKVILPKGKWYDFYTGEYAGDGETITVTPGLSKIPVYVKDGGMIPMMKPVLHTPKPDQKTDLEIRYYGSKSSAYKLYDDDGVSFDYEKGNYSWREIKVNKNADGSFSSSVDEPVKGKISTYGQITFKYMTNK